MSKRTEEQWEKHRFPLEAKLQEFITKRIKEYRKNNGKHIMMFKASDRYHSGISDLILCVCGEFVAVELKISNNKPTELQKQFLNDVNDAKGVAGVAWNWKDFKDIINPVLERHDKPLL